MPAGTPRNVLAVQLRRLGDLVLALPSFRAVKAAWPGARLTVVTEAPFHEILEGSPDVDHVLLHPRGAVSSVTFGLALSRHGFDVAIDFHGNPSSARLVAQSGAPVRVGWALRGRSLAYTCRVNVPPPVPPRYTADQKLDLVRALGVDASDARPRLAASPADREAAAARLRAAGIDADMPFAIAAPASRRAYKEWVPEKFAEALRLFREESGATVVLCGARSEEEHVLRVAPAMGPAPPVVLPASIREWIGLLDRARLFAGPDGGVKHVAQALRRRTLALFGPQDPLAWTPPPGDVPQETVRARRNDCTVRCSRRPIPCDCLTALEPRIVADRLVSLWP